MRKAISKSLKAGNTRYTPVVGEFGARKAICGYFSSTLGLEYNPSQIVITAGAKQGLYNLFQALVEHGDEVIIPAPYWGSYPGMVELAGAKPVIVDCNASGGYLTPKALYSAITANTKAVILNSP
ncbi:MAG: aminotransferase class I/II-fold pyridoxal phosphate-dependent enzyme, partial [Pseudomonadota bacterium]